ncbi:MAG: zeta toxin family protein [Synechococcus lacustris]|jgi:predicted ABC-type ATPase
MKQLWLLVGGNGAGKSTFYRLILEPLGLPFVNADRLAKLVYPAAAEEHSYEAALLAEQQRNTLLVSGASFCFETVFSHPSKIDFTARAKALGYTVIMVLIHLEQAELNAARVAQRVQEGGHNVPTEKLLKRIPRMLNQVKTAIPLCDEVRVLDNSSAENPFRPLMTIKPGQVECHQHPLPAWATQLLA